MNIISFLQFFCWRPNFKSNVNFSLNVRFIIIATRNYTCPGCAKRLKSSHELIKYINTCTSHEVFFIHMQPKKDNPIPREKENFGPFEDEKLTLEEQHIEGDYRNSGSKNLDIESHARDDLAECTPQAGLFRSKSSLFLKKIWFCDQEFAADILVSNIKYNHLRFQNNNPFYLFHDQLDYGLAKYFAEFETIKSNIHKFLFEPLMAPLTKKLSY